jgi:hypothetical protein
LNAQRDYIRAVKKPAAFLGRSPDTATAEELRAFQLHLTAAGVQPPAINAAVTVLRFFFKVTLDFRGWSPLALRRVSNPTAAAAHPALPSS